MPSLFNRKRETIDVAPPTSVTNGSGTTGHNHNHIDKSTTPMSGSSIFTGHRRKSTDTSAMGAGTVGAGRFSSGLGFGGRRGSGDPTMPTSPTTMVTRPMSLNTGGSAALPSPGGGGGGLATIRHKLSSKVSLPLPFLHHSHSSSLSSTDSPHARRSSLQPPTPSRGPNEAMANRRLSLAASASV